MTNPNTMALWDAVSKTNPANTKRVNQRGGFTAIAAHSQVMEATRQFGPIGIGWGFDTGLPIRMDELLIVPVLIWHGARENTFGPIYGSTDLHDAKGRLDNDAPKKATTDGLTKGLSLLGFNADVFLGRFDDNKYIEQMNQEFAGEKISDAQWAFLVQLIEAKGADTERFCKYMKVTDLKALPEASFNAAVKALEAKPSTKKENAE